MRSGIIGYIFFVLIGTSIVQAHDELEHRVEALSRIIESDGVTAQHYSERGSLYLIRGDAGLARKDFEEAMKRGGASICFYDISRTYFAENAHKPALVWLDRYETSIEAPTINSRLLRARIYAYIKPPQEVF